MDGLLPALVPVRLPRLLLLGFSNKKACEMGSLSARTKTPSPIREDWGEQTGRACNPTPNDLLNMSGCNPDLLGTFCHFERSEKSFSHCLKISPHFDRRKDNILLPPKT